MLLDFLVDSVLIIPAKSAVKNTLTACKVLYSMPRRIQPIRRLEIKAVVYSAVFHESYSQKFPAFITVQFPATWLRVAIT